MAEPLVIGRRDEPMDARTESPFGAVGFHWAASCVTIQTWEISVPAGSSSQSCVRATPRELPAEKYLSSAHGPFSLLGAQAGYAKWEWWGLDPVEMIC
jgi:hypothetical protein